MNTVIDVLNFVKNWKINNGYSDGAIVPFHTYVACTAPSAVVFSLCQCRPHSLHVARQPLLWVQVVYLSAFVVGGKNGAFCG